ncbi:MAG: phospholipase D-like domain-containing protein [Rhizobacter sp.]
MGIDLYELSSSRLKDNKRPFLFGSSLGRLHAKLVVIDRKRLFIGSMNLDPRSATINTELGAMIQPTVNASTSTKFSAMLRR